MLAAIDFHGLGQVVWVSLVAGVGVTVLFSLVIYGCGKADDGAGAAGHAGRRRSPTARSPCGARWPCSSAPAVVIGVVGDAPSK